MSNAGLVVIDNNGIATLMDAYGELVELWEAVEDAGIDIEQAGVVHRGAILGLSQLLSGCGITRARLERRRVAQHRMAEVV